MIQSIHIQNFKSVVDLSLDLGRFNVLIGENGCGKSNILEAIAFGAAASADKLDYEFMGSRGIRLTNPEFMYSAFKFEKNPNSIGIIFRHDDTKYTYDLFHNKNSPKTWSNRYQDSAKTELKKIVDAVLLVENERLNKLTTEFGAHGPILNILLNDEKVQDLVANTKYQNYILNKIVSNPTISNFIIYSPEESRLRKFEDSDHIYPLGIKGQGLFQYLKEFTLDSKNEAAVQEIKDTLALLDWYKDFRLPDNLMRNEFALSIQDKYLDERLRYFDQRSTNEGFLFLLFYATLFISDLTPTFFAIDNIEASFNPKLCTELISTLVQLAKKHKKQVIVTTHNPAVLDGLDLQDDSQRLFVVRRNDEGHTRVRRIEHKPERTMKLSEIWTKGFIGGLPDNF